MTALEILSRQFSEIDIPERVDRFDPKLEGVYFLADDVIQYVGQSADILSRVNAHRIARSYRGMRMFTMAFWYPIPRGCMSYYEGAFIRALRPEYNLRAPNHCGYDNEILEGFGLEPHADEYANAASWLELQARRRAAWRAGHEWAAVTNVDPDLLQ